ncbi:hypothetical protein BU14_1963s0001 [Porphyra umbilicalis]|uniref:Uncharacterized protein n=1 Tax=Porphyra umbilicalis TaxID=2786 RepID=A0A1X6NK93_PORUM|nr:hypothetical protein BU14_1963s0001 [Porphyra umbilicalis]|eukprot:OSX69018.1 hypothetical protein BU14_1963s0001 [Porphyra umbilicalis]
MRSVGVPTRSAGGLVGDGTDGGTPLPVGRCAARCFSRPFGGERGLPRGAPAPATRRSAPPGITMSILYSFFACPWLPTVGPCGARCGYGAAAPTPARRRRNGPRLGLPPSIRCGRHAAAADDPPPDARRPSARTARPVGGAGGPTAADGRRSRRTAPRDADAAAADEGGGGTPRVPAVAGVAAGVGTHRMGCGGGAAGLAAAERTAAAALAATLASGGAVGHCHRRRRRRPLPDRPRHGAAPPPTGDVENARHAGAAKILDGESGVTDQGGARMQALRTPHTSAFTPWGVDVMRGAPPHNRGIASDAWGDEVRACLWPRKGDEAGVGTREGAARNDAAVTNGGRASSALTGGWERIHGPLSAALLCFVVFLHVDRAR